MTNEEVILVMEYYKLHFASTREAIEAFDVVIEALEQAQYYKDLAQSYEKTINKLTEAISENRREKICL